MVKLSETLAIAVGKYKEETLLDAALAHAREGWHVFPLRPGSKAPLISKAKGGNGALDGTTDPAQIRAWWKQYPNAGIGANLGDDRVAVDLDFNHGATRLASLPATRTHHSGRGNGNIHLVYRVEPGSSAAALRSGTNVFGPGVDVRAGRGSYIVLPPTLHEETGQPYSLDPVLRTETVLTDAQLTALYEEAGVTQPAKSRGAKQGLSVVEGSRHQRPMVSSNSTLAGLLADPPQEGGRNDWFTKVCGHVARDVHKFSEFEKTCLNHSARLDPPLPVEELQKTLQSVWDAEQAKPDKTLMDENGYLTGNKARLFVQTSQKVGDETVYGQAPYADFDVEARGVAVDDSARRVYWVRLYWGQKVWDTTLPGELLGRDAEFKTWLAGRGMSTAEPFNASPKGLAPATRILRYLNYQQPPEVHIVTTLGWDDKAEGFVTHEGVITESGARPKEEVGVVANPLLLERQVAPFNYGFGRDATEAQRVLQEVLTFQDEEVTSVFGAWWAACFLKPQVHTQTALFPFFGVEATSESGKTNGFFDLMVALNGNTQGQVVPTKPVLRDFASANKSGIVWADDLSDLSPYEELLRASTSNGTASKMEADRSGVKNTQLVAPVLISGEALGMGTQKALLDRSVILEVQSPKERKSRHNPDVPQWLDVVALKQLYPESGGGLTVLSGWYVKSAMQHRKAFQKALQAEARKATGRHGDKLAVLRAGAMLLDALVGHGDPWSGQGEHYRRVARWCDERSVVLDQDNALTLEVLPWALRQWDFPDQPSVDAPSNRFAGITTPAFVKGDLKSTQPSLEGDDLPEIWYSPTLLADAWKRDNPGKVESRTHSSQSLQKQAEAVTGRRAAKRVDGTTTQVKYRLLPVEYTRAVLSRAGGDQ